VLAGQPGVVADEWLRIRGKEGPAPPGLGTEACNET